MSLGQAYQKSACSSQTLTKIVITDTFNGSDPILLGVTTRSKLGELLAVPPDITAEDVEGLRAAEWEDEAIYYAITICVLFNLYNHWVEAGGAHLSRMRSTAGAGRGPLTQPTPEVACTTCL